MRSLKWILLYSLGGLLLFSFCISCSAPKEKEFAASGMRITLTDAFKEGKYYNMTAYYDWEEEDVTVSATKEAFSLLEDEGESTTQSLDEYAKALMKASELTAEVKNENGLTYFNFEKTPNDVTYIYYAIVFRTDDAYWLFQFTCPKDSENKYAGQIMEWAQSIRFDS